MSAFRSFLAPGVLFAASLTLGVSSLTGERGQAPSGPTLEAPAAGVLSPRRLPGVLGTVVADSRLALELDGILDDARWRAAREKTCLVVARNGRTVFERRPDDLLTPASNLKVLTALAVLERLGPDERFVTAAKASVTPVDGTINGPLHLIGGGDPLLATADYAAHFVNQPQVFTALEYLADRIRDAGIRRITGGIVGDESRYDTQRGVPSWESNYLIDGEIGTASALGVNDTFVTWAPRRQVAPAPAAHTASVLSGLLSARGIVVEGANAAGTAPPTAVTVASVESPPMVDIVAEMLRESDNMTAELLVKELGHRFRSKGTTVDGVAVMRATLQTSGLPAAEVENVDGSGLDRSDKATCSVLVQAITTTTSGPLIKAGLPVAGETGTLSLRFDGHPAEGRMRAKTGSLNYVTGLTGFLDHPTGRPLAFSLLANDLPDRVASGRALQEQVAAALAAYPEAPPSGELVP